MLKLRKPAMACAPLPVRICERSSAPSRTKNLSLVLERADIERLEQLAYAERARLLVRDLTDRGIRVGELVGLTVTSLWYAPGLRSSRFAAKRTGIATSRTGRSGPVHSSGTSNGPIPPSTPVTQTGRIWVCNY